MTDVQSSWISLSRSLSESERKQLATWREVISMPTSPPAVLISGRFDPTDVAVKIMNAFHHHDNRLTATVTFNGRERDFPV